MASNLARMMEAARKRLGLSPADYAARVGLTRQGLAKIQRGGGVNASTLALLQEHGGIRVTPALVASFYPAD